MNLSQVMKELGRIQERMAAAQRELESVHVVGSAGGGMVEATMNGRGDLVSIKIEKEVVDPNDVEMLEELVVAAVAAARKEAQAAQAQRMSEIAGGLPIPPIPGITA